MAARIRNERGPVMYTVTTRTPSGNQRIVTVKRMREAGQVIAYTLADNTGIGRQAATALAMFAEKNGHLESHGYTFTITKEEAQMITDTQARTIASDWHGGGGTALYAFASTGAIDTARADHNLIGEIDDSLRDLRVPDGAYVDAYEPDDRERQDENLTDLRSYVREHGKRGPQPGWADLTW